ncbi:hypothetical protein GCM10009007_02120 [Formosimonas limnophila]|uniref:Lipoprotein n=1 Tax=Formosimonas limnophila TaxID=1384487 RepID=A0A8J3FYE4_9BURK|nr:hypothetical protein [Formosimonas limnophila]GHA65210.1 hypothetical protein GCM10009007_02120 [Formosimonas limnophila]
MIKNIRTYLTLLSFVPLSGCMTAAIVYSVAKSPQEAYQPTIFKPNEAATLKVIGENAVGITFYPDAACFSDNNPEKKKLSGGFTQSIRNTVNGPEAYVFKVNAGMPQTLRMGYSSSINYCSGDISRSFLPKPNASYEAYLQLIDSKCVFVLNEIAPEGRVSVSTDYAAKCQ